MPLIKKIQKECAECEDFLKALGEFNMAVNENANIRSAAAKVVEVIRGKGIPLPGVKTFEDARGLSTILNKHFDLVA